MIGDHGEPDGDSAVKYASGCTVSTRGGVVNSQPEGAGGDESLGKRERSRSGAGRPLLVLSPGLDKLESFLVSEDSVSNNSPKLLAKTYLVPPLLVPRNSYAGRLDKYCVMADIRSARRPHSTIFAEWYYRRDAACSSIPSGP